MTWVYPGKGPIKTRLDPPKSIRLFTVLFWPSVTISVVAEFYFWDDTIFDLLEDDGRATLSPFETQLIWAGLVAIIYAILALFWFFITEKRSRFAKWFYVLLLVPNALALLLSFEEYALDELAMYGSSTLLSLASACFLFTPEARNWFAGKIQIDPSVFE